MAYIKVIQHEDAEGELKQIFDNIVKSRGKLAEVHKIQSLNPKTIVNHMDLYMSIMFGQSPLKRYQREMIAVVVSRANDCDYCQVHHGEALNHYWKDETKIEALKKDYHTVALDPTDKKLCDFAWLVTTEPSSGKSENVINDLKTLGLEDRAILDANLVTCYFNFVNRMVLGLGIKLEDKPGGFKY